MRQTHRTIGLHSLGFVVVTLAAYLSALVTMGYVLRTISISRAGTLVIIAAAYLVIGTIGYTWARNLKSLKSALVYFAIQIVLAATLLFATKSPGVILGKPVVQK